MYLVSSRTAIFTEKKKCFDFNDKTQWAALHKTQFSLLKFKMFPSGGCHKCCIGSYCLHLIIVLVFLKALSRLFHRTNRRKGRPSETDTHVPDRDMSWCWPVCTDFNLSCGHLLPVLSRPLSSAIDSVDAVTFSY